MGGVVADAKGAGDDFGDWGQCPQIGTEPVRPSSPQEGLQQLGTLSRCDPRRPPRRWLGPQGIGATRPDFGLPPTHGRRRTTDLSGDLAHPKPIFEEGDGPPQPRFQLCGTALGSHAAEITIVPVVMQASIGPTGTIGGCNNEVKFLKRRAHSFRDLDYLKPRLDFLPEAIPAFPG